MCNECVGVRPKARPQLKQRRGPTVSDELCVFTQVANRRVPRPRNHLLTKRMHEGGRPALAGGNVAGSGSADRCSDRQMC